MKSDQPIVKTEIDGNNQAKAGDQHHPPRGARRRAIVGSGIIILLAIATFLFWQWQRPMTLSAPASSRAGDESLVVNPQAVSRDIGIIGTVGPGRSIAVLAPFDGVIHEKNVQLGDHVDVGDLLLVMDTGDITSRFREAQTAYLKAQAGMQAMDDWESSPDVQRAKRALETTENTLTSLEQQVADSKVLLDKGIISRNEYDNSVQQRDGQKAQVAGNEDDLAAARERGNSVNRQMVELEFENAKDKLNDLKQQISGAKIAAAVPGIITRPPNNKDNQPSAQIEVGATLQRGTSIYAIADTSTFIATGTVDEMDINDIDVGMPVTIVGDAFPGQALTGKIVSVSSQASEQQALGNGSPTFEVRAAFSADTKTQEQMIRIGMSVRMTVQTYSNPNALVVPINALLSTENNQKALRVIRDRGVETIPVLIGLTFASGVEVTSGLRAGDKIIVPQAE